MKVIPNHSTVETVKTVLIAILVTAIIGFVGGMKYEQANSQRIVSAVSQVQEQPSK